MSEHDPRFTGRWLLENEQERRTAEFTAAGAMTYTLQLGDRELVIELTWHTEGDTLVSVQVKDGRVTHAKYAFEGGTLVLDYGNERFTFVRVV